LSFRAGPLSLTTVQVAALIGANEHTVGRMAKKGEIPGAFRIGTRWRFPTARETREPPFSGGLLMLSK
jgi:excisionase family DNA binding protein